MTHGSQFGAHLPRRAEGRCGRLASRSGVVNIWCPLCTHIKVTPEWSSIRRWGILKGWESFPIILWSNSTPFPNSQGWSQSPCHKVFHLESFSESFLITSLPYPPTSTITWVSPFPGNPTSGLPGNTLFWALLLPVAIPTYTQLETLLSSCLPW